MSSTHHIGQRVSYDGALCTVRYVGPVDGQTGSWLGVEWDDASRGKHDGSHKGVRYFECVSKSPNAASLIRPSRPADPPRSFIAALRDKYGGSSDKASTGAPAPAPIIISGKVAEEMGFDKIARNFAQLDELKTVILDGMRINEATAEGDGVIGETCPSIKHLDVSRNLFEGLGPVAAICRELPVLHTLVLNGNRFQQPEKDEALLSAAPLFERVAELSIEDSLLDWDQLINIARKCPSLVTFNPGTNQLTSLPVVDFGDMASTLTSLYLEYNDFTTLASISGLAGLRALRNLHLKGNNITEVESNEDLPAAVFSPSLNYLDLSYNNVQSWSFVDQLQRLFPGLTALRLSHNPVYDMHDSADPKTSISSSEEAYMFTVGRLANLQSLNYTRITTTDRTNAEMFYLSRIARQLAAVPEDDEVSVLVHHPRYKQLCEVYGEPDVNRRREVNPAYLEARLVKVSFHLAGTGDERAAVRRIPKSFDIYAVKGIAARLFGLLPLHVDLVWETGEWDPVGGYDDQEDETEHDSSDEEDAAGAEQPAGPSTDDGVIGGGIPSKAGRWVKREVKLKDGPRQLGYCVDGPEVTIRVEANN